MLYFGAVSTENQLRNEDLRDGLFKALDKLGPRNRVLVVPPDSTRAHSRAGELTRHAFEYYGDRLTDVIPAIGTHVPMSDTEIARMYEGVPRELFRIHDWRNGTVTLGEVPAAFVEEVSAGAANFAWPAQVADLIAEGGHDLVLSIGQVVPHEVAGMANYNKNLFVGTGGPDGINRSHFVGAAYGMERIMGRADTPVRRLLNYASDHFASDLPVVYVHTVVRRSPQGALQTAGLFIGDDIECFDRAAELSLKVNLEMLDRPLDRVVVYLEPSEFGSTWLGNKSIYRTRMAIADGGELIVLAPGVKTFGEDMEIDRLIREHGYVGTPAVMKALDESDGLQANLSAAAHLIHGSSEGRFSITYCPGGLTRDEIEGVNFRYADLDGMTARYDPRSLRNGYNTLRDGSELFYVSNPAIGLWACRDRFE